MLTNDATKTLLDKIYKNVTMGEDAIHRVLPKISASPLRTEMTAQLCDYTAFSAKTVEMLTEAHAEAREEKFLKRYGARMGIGMNLMFDSSDKNIAEMVSRGTKIGIKELEEDLRSCIGEGCDDEARELGNRVLSFERNAVERIKPYL